MNMTVTVIDAEMRQSAKEGYTGWVSFRMEGHKQPYEVSLASKKGNDWEYSLQFAHESGPEEQIELVEVALEEDDDLFDSLIDAAMAKLKSE